MSTSSVTNYDNDSSDNNNNYEQSGSNSVESNTMILTGEGQVLVVPDLAIIRLGVETTGENLMTLQSDNALAVQTILEALVQMNITDIKTFQYTIQKVFDYQDNQQIDRGYSVRNIMEIRLNDLDQIGMVIDTAVNNGANVVDFISFEVSDSERYYREALNLAVRNAIEKAASIARYLDLPKAPEPFRIVENSTSPIPYNTIAIERSFATPIEPGQKQIEALVTIHFYY